MTDQDTTTPVDPIEPETPSEDDGQGQGQGHTCPDCEATATKHAENEAMNFAILIALVPALTLTFLTSAGLL